MCIGLDIGCPFLHPSILLIRQTPVIHCPDCTGVAYIKPVSFLLCNAQTKPHSWKLMEAFVCPLTKAFNMCSTDMPKVQNHKYSHYSPAGLCGLCKVFICQTVVVWCIISEDPVKWRWDMSLRFMDARCGMNTSHANNDVNPLAGLCSSM